MEEVSLYWDTLSSLCDVGKYVSYINSLPLSVSSLFYPADYTHSP
jgi:hypothetical protein